VGGKTEKFSRFLFGSLQNSLYICGNINTMKAKLVYIDLLVRVIVPDNATDDEIMNAASDKALQESNWTWFNENVTEIKDDVECPYDPEKYGDPKQPIGYQIESINGRHEIPEEFHSFEILSERKADEWMADDGHSKLRDLYWMKVPIYEGDIEDPTFLD
jgi:hypothetical protein